MQENPDDVGALPAGGAAEFFKRKADNMKQVQRGFTLIELVMVIVILGVLAAVAIPRFVDLRGDAVLAATQGVAGGLSSASSVNFATRSVRGATTASVAVTTCGTAADALQGGLPAGYQVNNAATLVGAGANVLCEVANTTVTPNVTAAFTAIGIL